MRAVYYILYIINNIVLIRLSYDMLTCDNSYVLSVLAHYYTVIAYYDTKLQYFNYNKYNVKKISRSSIIIKLCFMFSVFITIY